MNSPAKDTAIPDPDADIRLSATNLFSNQYSNEDILLYIKDKGYSDDEANIILQDVHSSYSNDHETVKPKKQTRVIYGIILLAVGIFFSFVVPTGRIFYGAIGLGAYILIKGLLKE